jgi:hypothetical protein
MARRSGDRSRPVVDTNPVFADMIYQHETALRLLSPQVTDESLNSKDEVAMHHDQNSLSKTLQGSTGSSDEGNASPRAVLWTGLPFSSLVWELSGVFLAVCFLGRSYFLPCAG